MEVHINPIALRKAKIVYNFGLSECNKVKSSFLIFFFWLTKCEEFLQCKSYLHFFSKNGVFFFFFCI